MSMIKPQIVVATLCESTTHRFRVNRPLLFDCCGRAYRGHRDRGEGWFEFALDVNTRFIFEMPTTAIGIHCD